MKAKSMILIIGIFYIMYSLSACSMEEKAVGQKAEIVEFPEYYEKTYNKLSFKADVLIPNEANVNQMNRYTAIRAKYDTSLAYDKFFKNIDVKEIHKGDVLGDSGKMIKYEDYIGSNRETLYLNGQSLTFSLPFSRYVWDCVYPESGHPRYNLDKYELGGNLKFMNVEDVYKQILSILKGIGLPDNIDFIPAIYALDYKTMEQEEYDTDMYGNEDTSNYKASWDEQDDCYYCYIRQKIEGLPLYYVYGDAIKDLEVCYTGVEVIYSKEGIQRLDIDKLFEINDSNEKKPVSLLNLDELTKTIEKQYEMIISDNIFEINKMELYMMAQKNTKNSYDIFPVWILFMEQIHTDGKKEIRTPMQNVINAETGEIIS